MPKTSQKAVRQLEDAASPISAFLRDRCKIDPEASVEVDDLWEAWKEWCDKQGRKSAGLKEAFGRDLSAAMDVEKQRRREDDKRVQIYVGIRLLEPREVGNPDEDDLEEEDDDGAESDSDDELRESLDIHTDVAMTTMTTPPKSPSVHSGHSDPPLQSVGNPLLAAPLPIPDAAMPVHRDHYDQQSKQAVVTEQLDRLLNPKPKQDRAAEDDASKVGVGEHPDESFEEWLDETQMKLPEDDEKGR